MGDGYLRLESFSSFVFRYQYKISVVKLVIRINTGWQLNTGINQIWKRDVDEKVYPTQTWRINFEGFFVSLPVPKKEIRSQHTNVAWVLEHWKGPSQQTDLLIDMREIEETRKDLRKGNCGKLIKIIDRLHKTSRRPERWNDDQHG